MKENPTTKNVAIRSVNDMLRLLREKKPIVNLSTTEELDNENEARLICSPGFAPMGGPQQTPGQ